MNDDFYGDEQQFDEELTAKSRADTYADSRKRTRFLRALLLWLPLLVCAGCLMLSAVRPGLQGVPVTGGDPLAPPTPAAGEAIQPPPSRTLVTDPAVPYKEEAALRLHECNSAFHTFFLLEQVAIHQPDLASSEEWRKDATFAMQDFTESCQPLGAMPFVPSAYADVDRWMKLAAAEVTPAAESFAALLEGDGAGRQGESIDHLLRFIEYTRKAEDLMDRLERRKQI